MRNSGNGIAPEHDSRIRAALYARVSSEKQAQEGTIDSQLAAIEQRAQQDAVVIDPEMRFLDDGYSGATLVRPALERLRDVASAGAIDRLYVLCPDRLARKYAYQVLLVDELRRCDAEVVFVNHELGRSPEDDLLLQVQGMVAEYERAKILERSRRGRLHAARRGDLSVLSMAPYGYRYVRRQEGGGKAAFNVHLDEARVVRQIFEWVGLDRLSIGEVCRRLKKQGICSPRGKSSWDHGTVCQLLRNPAYKGSAAYGKTRKGERRPRLRPLRGQAEQPRLAYALYDTPPDQWVSIPVPAIVEEELFTAVAEQLEENRRRSRQRRHGAVYLLQGLLVCKCCGYSYYGKQIGLGARGGKTPPYAYYRCLGSDAYRFGGQRVCPNKPVRNDLLDEAVWKDVRALLADGGRVEQEFERRLHGREGDRNEQHVQKLTATIRKVQRGIARLIDAYQEGLLDKHDFEPRIKAAREHLVNLRAEIQSLADLDAQAEQMRLVIGNLQAFAERVKAGLDDADWNTRRGVIRTLVKRIEIDHEQVRVVYRVDSGPFAQGPERGSWQHCRRRQSAAVAARNPAGGYTI